MKYLFTKDQIEIITTKGTGPGGQHKNKTETAVTIKHLSTGIVVRNQETRSKIRNIESAKKQLNAKLCHIVKQTKHNELNDSRKDAVFSQRIRTYNYQRNEVIDHRTGKTADLKKVLDGDLHLINNI